MTVRLLAAQWEKKGLGEPPSAAVRALVASLAEGFAAARAAATGPGAPGAP
jgi:hypothetical protein